MAIIAIAALSMSAQADDQQPLNLNDKITIQEVNKALDARKNVTDGPAIYYFGFDLRGSPLEDARQYLAFLDYLSRSTGYIFKLRFSSKHTSVIEDLGTGRTNFAAVGAVSFIQGSKKYPISNIVRGVNGSNLTKYQSIIVTSPTSDIHSIADIKGTRFAFGSNTSTQGYLIPLITLAQEGIGLEDLLEYKFTGSHRNCANAVIYGGYGACGMQDTMAKALANQGLVQIVHTSNYYPSSGIAANNDVPDNVLQNVKQALLDFDPEGRDKAALYHWDRTEMPNGFQTAEADDYTELEGWLVRLGLLGKGPSIGKNGRRP